MCYTESLRGGVVTLNHVSKIYRRGRASVPAVQDITVHIPAGQFCALMGPSGCGKSTLLNLIAGLDAPSEGEVILAGRPVRHLTRREWTDVRRHLIGMVFQAFHLIPGLTAEENVALPLILKGEPADLVRDRVRDALDQVGMRGRASHRPGELSGGEQQRVALARALAHRPRLILADEPTGNLDSRNGMEVVSLLRALPQSGQTVIMATHSEAAARHADCVHRLQDGRLAAVGERS